MNLLKTFILFSMILLITNCNNRVSGSGNSSSTDNKAQCTDIPTSVETYGNMSWNFCSETALGCTERVDISGESYLIVPMCNEITSAIATLKSTGTSMPLSTLKGVRVSENGHMPNPTVEQKVLNVYYLSY